MAGKVLTGNRAKVYVDGKLVGIFDSCNYSSALGTEDIFILTVLGCVPTNTGENYNAKTTSKISIGYKGLRGFDESGDSDESDAADLP
jgi:hypothetical protein